jgi:hypothetical protein
VSTTHHRRKTAPANPADIDRLITLIGAEIHAWERRAKSGREAETQIRFLVDMGKAMLDQKRQAPKASSAGRPSAARLRLLTTQMNEDV